MANPDYPETARLTEHARLRCLEMNVDTKRVKRLLRRPDIVRSSYRDRYVAVGDSDPKIAVVYVRDPDGTIQVITVLFRDYEYYDRQTFDGQL